MLKVLELFSGIGAQHKALTRLGVSAEFTQCEIDKYAISSYNAIHGETKNLGDICKVKEENLEKNQWDLITYSFPCTDISIAGKMLGGDKNSGTRSSLLWEVEKFIRIVRPKYLLMENVKNLVGKKFFHTFKEWLLVLEKYGYNNYWQVLNAKDYGIPQNRSRVFCVSIRKDLRQGYEFPKKEPLKIYLSDLLEKEVDEKYYLSDKMLKCFLKDTGDSFNRKDRFLSSLKSVQKNNVALTITTRAGSRSTDNFIDTYQFAKSDNFMNGKDRLQINKNISDTLQTSQKEAVVFSKMETTTNLKTQLCNKLIEENKVKPFDIVKHSYSNNRLKEKRRIVENNNSNLAITLTTRADTIGVVVPTIDQLRIRKLTPLETFLLMGFDKEDYEKVKATGISNAQMYKIMGNSIVVNVLEKIFYNLLIEKKEFDRLF